MFGRTALAALAASAVAANAAAEISPRPEWDAARTVGDNTCATSGPVAGDARLSLVAEMGLFMLLVESRDLPAAKAEYPMEMRIDDGPVITLSVMGADSIVGVPIGGELARAVTSASTLTFTVAGHTYSFHPHNLGAALDAVARCAHVPTLAEREKNAPKPIPGAGEWLLVDQLPGAPGQCSARRNGREVDTILMINNKGGLILTAGRPDWGTWGGEIAASLAVDGGSSSPVKALALNNLVFAPIEDAALSGRLRKAKTLDWTLPNGRFHAEVDGLGTALDAVKACMAQHGKAQAE